MISDALNSALERIAVDLDEAERPELDHDTRGVPGSPDIVATILSKIAAASVFVADVTPIAVSESGKHVANPNVLIELGYAKRALGTERVILVWNTAFTDAQPEDLPFDMRGRRAPFPISLAPDADRTELRRVRAELSLSLEAAVRASLGTVPAAVAAAPSWHPTDDNEPSIWRGGANPLMVNRGAMDGSTEISIEPRPRAYARMIPSSWIASPKALATLEGPTTYLIPLGRSTGINWGPTRGGFVSYRSSERIEKEGVTPSATRWFRDTGEIWGVSSSFFSQHDDEITLSTGYAVERWIAWLKHTAIAMAELGGVPPFHVELGIDGLDGARWPARGWGGDNSILAIEDRLSFSGSLMDANDDAIADLVEGSFKEVTTAFGLEALSRQQFSELARRPIQ